MKTCKLSVTASCLAVFFAVGISQSPAQTGPNPAVDYTKPNYANSPIIRKFVDSLPGLGAANSNNLGQYIPVAVPDTNTYPNTDYYEIGMQDHTEKMHSDLPATKTRGYRQLNTADPAVSAPHYLGPLIIAQRDRAVRVLFTNMLANGVAGNLFLPVDTTLMGAGVGPSNDVENYTQNRATLHLHGGFTPWISDGTPHQWTVPAGETNSYKKGVSTQNVPDMPDPGEGAMTFYYPNQQSARLQFYHDHVLGMTRLNVYAGEVAAYLIQDKVEASLVNSGIIPTDQIPLIIQDKTFVPDSVTLAAKDPLWDTASWGSTGSLWFPHVYMPNQDPSTLEGANPLGRLDYGPWFWPIFPVSEPLPALSCVPEGFMDTPVVNGTAYPYLTVEPKAYRFRILNGCNDRFFNLQLYYVDPADPNGTEVKMVPAQPTAGFPDTWPIDNREGGVPDPALVGPNMIMIGSEGGFLPAPAVIPNQPVNYVYDRRNIVVLNVDTHALYLGPAERADIIIDFSQVPPGSKLILYNDAPAPVPASDPRNDYYTDDPDQTENGGAPTTVAGYGPNTRTIMQFRVNGTWTPPYNLDALTNALALAFKAAQPVAIVSNGVYARIQDTALNLTGSSQPIGRLILVDGGEGGYTSAPNMTITGGGGTGATAQAYISGVSVLTLTSGGSNYVSAPTVTFVGGGASTSATATATITTGSVTALTLTFSGADYTSAPTVVISGGGGTNATATATIDPGVVTAVRLTNPGAGYSYSPDVSFLGGGSLGAVAAAQLADSTPMQSKAIQELFDTRGRMNASLGVELPFTTAFIQTTIPYGYIDPITESIPMGGTQLWKITHNGVDTHAVHFHLVNVQVINRVGWDGAIRPPDPEELGWKETVKMNPLEDTIVALKAEAPKLPFAVTNSVRPLAPVLPLGSTMGFAGIDPTTGVPIAVSNVMTDFGWEYVWHCHLLGHEENDMMRPFVMTGATNYVGTTNYVAPGYLSMNVQPAVNAGFITANPAPGAGPYASGTVVTLTATPIAPYEFVSWSGDATGTFANAVDVTMDTYKSVTANFVAPQQSLTLNVSPAGAGSITYLPLPITSNLYTYGTVVTLTAVSNFPYVFNGWTGDATGSNNPIQVTITNNATVTANFTAPRYAVSTTVLPGGAGLITADPAAGGDGKYAYLTSVTLTLVPSAGYSLAQWLGDASGSAYSVQLVMNGNKAVSAVMTNGLPQPVIDFQPIPDQLVTTVLGLKATSSSGLPVTFSVVSGPALLRNGTNLYFSNEGQVVVAATDSGNAYWGSTTTTRVFSVYLALPAYGPNVLINGRATPVTVSAGEAPTVQISMNPANYAGYPCDWWLVVNANGSWYYASAIGVWNAVPNIMNAHTLYQGPLVNISPLTVLSGIPLQNGVYTFYFGVDDIMDGLLDGFIWSNSNQLIVQ